MSRIPQTSSTRTPTKTSTRNAPSPAPSRLRTVASSKSLKAAPAPASLKAVPSLASLKTGASSARVGAQSPARLKPAAGAGVPKSPARAKAPPLPNADRAPSPSKPALSIREAIAVKRAEAKKAAAKSGMRTPDEFGTDAVPDAPEEEEPDLLGRPPVRETIEQARSTGSLNLSSRSLPCLPSALFDIHLGVTPAPLALVPEEPLLPPSATRARAHAHAPSWYDAQDLEVLRAGNNEIVELQPEIALFGSLKNVDLHGNKLTCLPSAFADLMALAQLDLSHNALTSLPPNLFALPQLVTLNLSHNLLATLPFGAPFSPAAAHDEFTSYTRTHDAGPLFAPVLSRAGTPLPRLHTLNISSNKLSAAAIDHAALPTGLTILDISHNPLGGGSFGGAPLMRALAALEKLRELNCAGAEFSDDALPADPPLTFPALRVLDLGETQVTPPAVLAALETLDREVNFDVTADEPPLGTLRVVLGKRVVKEVWELDAERRARERHAKAASALEDDWEAPASAPARAVAEDAEQEKEKERTPTRLVPARVSEKKVEVVKEQWEIEAESGLFTAGAKRRARAAAAAAATGASTTADVASRSASISPTASGSGNVPPAVLLHSQYYSAPSQTLTLPPSAAPARAAHARSFSLAAPRLGLHRASSDRDLALPSPTLPLSAIAAHPPLAQLRILVLANRRMDQCVHLPAAASTAPGGFLPVLEELSLSGCALGDSVSVARGDEPPSARASEALLPLLACLFPSLRTLDLSYNTLTSAALTADALTPLVLSAGAGPGAGEKDAPARKGLRHLRLRGNCLAGLDGLRDVAEMFRGNRQVKEWTLEELDLRDNEVGALPPELGLLPLDVFLVDGNLFRVPQRRVWEREGTRGLLSWLRGRIE